MATTSSSRNSISTSLGALESSLLDMNQSWNKQRLPQSIGNGNGNGNGDGNGNGTESTIRFVYPTDADLLQCAQMEDVLRHVDAKARLLVRQQGLEKEPLVAECAAVPEGGGEEDSCNGCNFSRLLGVEGKHPSDNVEEMPVVLSVESFVEPPLVCVNAPSDTETHVNASDNEDGDEEEEEEDLFEEFYCYYDVHALKKPQPSSHHDQKPEEDVLHVHLVDARGASYPPPAMDPPPQQPQSTTRTRTTPTVAQLQCQSEDHSSMIFSFLQTVLPTPTASSPQSTIGILVRLPPNTASSQPLLQEEEAYALWLQQLCNFRTSDAATDFYLHAIVPLAFHPQTDEATTEVDALLHSVLYNQMQNDHDDIPMSSSGCLLLVYRHLPPRDHLQTHPDKFQTLIQHRWDAACAKQGIPDLPIPATLLPPIMNGNDPTNDPNISADLAKRILWEVRLHKPNTPPPNASYDSEEEDDELVEQTKVLYRPVSPPYLPHTTAYPVALQPLLDPQNIQLIKQEALQIPHWEPWPEMEHYNSSSNGQNDTSNGSGGGGGYAGGKSDWSVFPLCHTFPANDASKRKWIGCTSQFCPETVRLLKQCRIHPPPPHDNHNTNHKGDAEDPNALLLRTALFSRLGPYTTLSPHTGWQDLANHVLRVHIPLVIPSGQLCGTWVDGQVQMHPELDGSSTTPHIQNGNHHHHYGDGDAGGVTVFDDSKVHRAFNYTAEDRIVLIVDLVRPEGLPQGTSVGGHTEELDQFIAAYDAAS